MTIVAGIDEAGYGPLLGPLVVAAAAYHLEDGRKEAALDRLLKDKRARELGLPTADSKALYSSGGSLARLETSTLGHLVLARGALPVRVKGVLDGAVDFHPGELAELPWYADLLERPLPSATTIEQVLERAAWHEQRLAELGARFLGLWVAPVLEPRFNRLTRASGTKAWTLFHATGRLIETLVAAHPHDELVIHVDRHGGRIHYGELLQTFFPLAPLSTLKEKPPESDYVLAWPGRPAVRIDFKVKADAGRTPVAMASVAAKTVRELFMASLNAWFTAQHPGLAPTAGYGTDGKRFLSDLKRLAPRGWALRERLERCR